MRGISREQIAERVGRSLSLINQRAQRSDFPPPVRREGRRTFYGAKEIDRWWRDGVDLRIFNGRKKRRSGRR